MPAPAPSSIETPQLVDAPPVPPFELTPNDFGLEPIEERFVAEYLKDCNASRAYRETHPECSLATSYVNSSQVLGKARVQAAVRAGLDAQLRRVQEAGDAELQYLAHVLNFNIQDVMDETGKILPVAQWPRACAHVLKVMRPGKYGTVLEFEDRQRAVEMRLKVFGLMVQKHDVTVQQTLEDIMARANEMQRALPAEAAS